MDLKWLTEIFRLSGWQIFALTLAAAIIYFGPTIGISPLNNLPSWSKQIALVALIICGALATAGVCQAAAKPLGSILRSADDWRRRRAQRARIVSVLNKLSAGEAAIIRYLVTINNERLSVYTSDVDSSNAYIRDASVDTLHNKGLVVSGTSFGSSPYDNYYIPKEVWEVLQERR